QVASIHIEDIQDQVELALMRMEEHELARGYILYRAQHAEKREQARANDKPTKRLLIDGVEQTFDPAQELRRLKSLCQGLNVDLEPIV
ncbi:ATP cone domain-containing protein, partial [Acinetobacter baumannii]